MLNKDIEFVFLMSPDLYFLHLHKHFLIYMFVTHWCLCKILFCVCVFCL